MFTLLRPGFSLQGKTDFQIHLLAGDRDTSVSIVLLLVTPFIYPIGKEGVTMIGRNHGQIISIHSHNKSGHSVLKLPPEQGQLSLNLLD